MAVSLSKGTNVSLTKEAPNVSAVTVGLGWDVRLTDGAAFDLDASAFVLGADDKVLSDAHRSEEHTSELQSLMSISYAVFCLKKKNRSPACTQNNKHDIYIQDR